METIQPQADKSWADRHPDQYVGSQEDEAAAKLRSHKEVEAYNQATVKEHEQLRSDNSARDIVQREQRQVDNQESEHTRQDEAEVEKHLRQASLCSELDDQVADKVRVKGRNKEISDNFKETWCWGGDAASEVDKAAARLKIYKDVDAYNKATVKEHQRLKSEKRTQEIMQREKRDLFNQESEHIRQDERDVDKQLRQSDLCSGLDRQMAEQLGVQEKAKANSKTCNEKWMFGGDSTTEMDEAADTYKKGRECDEYNRATVREHEQLKSEKRTQEIMEREQRDLFNQESEHTRQDERDVDKQLRQSDLCSGLDRQVAEQEKARENSKHCNKKWMFGGDSAQSEVDDAADTLKKGRECDEYNRATVREHEQLRKQDRRDELEQGKIDDEKIKQWFHNEDNRPQD